MKTLPVTNLVQAEQVRYSYRAKVPEDTTEAALADKAFWSHVANRLQFGTKIEILAEEGTWYQELLVVEVGNNWARVAPIMARISLEQAAPDEIIPSGYEVKWKGPALKYTVERLSDAKRLQTGFASKNEAAKWIAQHLSGTAKAA